MRCAPELILKMFVGGLGVEIGLKVFVAES